MALFFLNNTQTIIDNFENNKNNTLDNSIFICYSTPNYEKMTKVFLDSLLNITTKEHIIHKLDNLENMDKEILNKTGFQTELWYHCVTNKIKHLVDIISNTKKYPYKYFIFTDCDIFYISKNKDKWKLLFDFIEKNENDIFFMREGIKNEVNTGFFIIKNNDNLKNNAIFFNDVIEQIKITPKDKMPLGDQSVINSMLSRLNYNYIPKEYIICGETIFNKDLALLHHAVGVADVDEKIKRIEEIKKIIE